MKQIDVKEILDSVLIENQVTRDNLIRSSVERALEVAAEAEKRNEQADGYAVLMAEIVQQLIDREFEIYKNVEQVLQRTVNELQATKN